MEYGYFHHPTTAEFIGTAEDDATNKDQKALCGQRSANNGSAEIEPSPLPEDGWKDDIRVFFPTDLTRPHDTMIEVTGTIGIKRKIDGLESYFYYAANRLDERPDGNVDSVLVSPEFPKFEKYFSPAFAQSYSKLPILGGEGEIAFHVFGKPDDNWQAVQAYYRFEDRNGNVLAVIPMPLFQEVGR